MRHDMDLIISWGGGDWDCQDNFFLDRDGTGFKKFNIVYNIMGQIELATLLFMFVNCYSQKHE
jgi:hypothetical protein